MSCVLYITTHLDAITDSNTTLLPRTRCAQYLPAPNTNVIRVCNTCNVLRIDLCSVNLV